jgi:hypothetical protein
LGSKFSIKGEKNRETDDVSISSNTFNLEDQDLLFSEDILSKNRKRKYTVNERIKLLEQFP